MQDGIVQSVEGRCARIALASVGLEIKKNLNHKVIHFILHKCPDIFLLQGIRPI